MLTDTKFSSLYLQSGFDYVLYTVNGRDYTVRNPKLRDVLDLEKREPGLYYSYLYMLSTISLDMAEALWVESGIYWEEIKDEWAFFLQRCLGGEFHFIDVLVSEDNTKVITNALQVCDYYRDAFNWFFHTTGEWIFMTDNSVQTQNMDNTSLVNVKEIQYRGRNVYEYNEDNYRLTFHTRSILVDYLKKVNGDVDDYEFMRFPLEKSCKIFLEKMYKKHQKEAKRGAKVDLSSMVSSVVARGQSYKDLLDYPIFLIRDLYQRFYKIDNYNLTVQGYLQHGDPKKKLDYDKIDWGVIIK